MNNASNKRNVVNGTPQNELPPLSRSQKQALIGLAFFSLAILVFGVLRIKYQINSPFQYNNSLASANVQQESTSTGQVDYTTDTDKDGLSDYEENNVYATSPYLPDSDSDGFNDKDEVLHGTDPNCPTGQECQVEIVATSTDSSIFSTSSALLIPDEAATSSDPLAQMLSGASDAVSLRQLLLDNGMSKADLDKISDEDLMKGYQESLKNASQTNQ